MEFIEDSFKLEHIPLVNIDMMYITPVFSKFYPERCSFCLTKEKPSLVCNTNIPYRFVDWDSVFEKNIFELDLVLKRALLKDYKNRSFLELMIEFNLDLVKNQPGYLEFNAIHTKEIITNNQSPQAVLLTKKKCYYGKILIINGLIRFIFPPTPHITNGATRTVTWDQIIQKKIQTMFEYDEDYESIFFN